MIGVPDQLDLFVADAFDVKAKHVVDLMSRNLFSLAKRKRIEPIHHQSEDSFVRVTGDPEHGLATMHDQDILIFLISQLVHARNRGDSIGRRVWFSGYEFWRFTQKRKASGTGYSELWSAMERLHRTHIETDIRIGKRRRNHQFTWLSEIEQRSDGARHIGFEVHLPEFLYEAVSQDRPLVVTLDSRYFSLTSPLERWLYLFARKSAGKQQTGWTETIESLWQKSASTASKAEFAKAVRRIIRNKESSLFEYDIQPALLGRHQALHFERRARFPDQRHPTLTLLD